jgi:hypothetical protein
VTVLGCTFLSHIAETQKDSVTRFISGFEHIENWSIHAHNPAPAFDLAWLNSQVAQIEREEPYRAIVVLTHYSPTLLPQASNPRHAEDAAGVRSAFVTV